jgi:hypothetical protein
MNISVQGGTNKTAKKKEDRARFDKDSRRARKSVKSQCNFCRSASLGIPSILSCGEMP